LHVFGLLEKIQLDEDMTPRHPDRRALFDVASEQRGHFSTDQAAKAGYARDMLTYHDQRGTFQRVHCGVYRLRDYPSSPRDELVAAWLTVGSDVAVVSHESAPDQWGLSEVVPGLIHLTVLRAQRSLANTPPSGATVHTTTRHWADGDVRTHEGVRLTSPERTILDAAEAGTQPEQVDMAVAQVLARCWLDPAQLRSRAVAHAASASPISLRARLTDLLRARRMPVAPAP
jgi:predicted transcriptional regulator of viral defense system